MVPSGYKEDTVYSVVPSDGSGDLSFTRASNGTRINSAGLVEDCPWNMLLQSETFDNAVWGADAGNSKTANTTTAPNGTVTADTITASPTNVMNVYQIITTNDGVFSYTVYLKKDATNLIETYIYQTFGVAGFKAKGEINFDNGTFTASLGTGTIESVGNGWFRVNLSATLLSGANSFGIFTTSSTGTRSVFVYGAQLNIGSTAKPYFPTTDRLNVPRLTYQNGGGGCPSLLLEKQSTNLFTYSEQFDNAAWTKSSGSVTANQAISPDGTQNADLLVGEMYQQPTFANATTYSFSVFAKKESGTTIYLGYIDNVTGFVGGSITYIYSTGVVAVQQSANGSVSGQAIDMGNGYIRVIIKYTTIASVTFNYQYIGSAGSYVWGAQTEVSSYPTSYIPTTSASATRVADACFKTGISSLIGQTSGVLFVDFIAKGSYDSNNLLMLISTGSGGDLVYLNLVSGTIEAYIAASSSQQFLYTSGTVLTANTRHKLALGYANNDIVLYHNGTQLATDTSASIPACTLLRVGDFLGGTFQFGNTINQSILFPTRLTNAELASLTTL